MYELTDRTIDLFGVPAGFNGIPQFVVKDIPGVYRIVWYQIVDSFTFQPSKWGAPVAIEYRRSNPFAIVVDP